MKKYKLANRTKTSLNIFFMLLFSIGITFSYFYSNESSNYVKIIAVICEISAMAYFVIPTIIGNIYYDEKYIKISTDLFTDRKETIKFVIDELYTILKNKNLTKIISIKTKDQSGVGKTELLRKIRDIFYNKELAKKYLSDDFYKWTYIKKKIGDAHLVDYNPDTFNSIQYNYPKTIFKINLLLVDNMPVFYGDINKDNIIVYCKITSEEESVLSNMTVTDIKTLYSKKFYRDLSDEEASIVFEITGGNVKNINKILHDESTFTSFIKNHRTIAEIEFTMQIGDYKKAKEMLDNLSSNPAFIRQLRLNVDLEFEYKFLEADLTHLQNNYVESVEMLEALLSNIIIVNDDLKANKIIEKISHIKKHMGKFKEALKYISYLDKNDFTLRSLSLLLLSYTQYDNEEYLKEFLNSIDYIEINKITSNHFNDPYKTYKGVALIYNNLKMNKHEEISFENAHSVINSIIQIYEKHNSRFITNCYFIKAEFYRHQKRYDYAIIYYSKCLDIYIMNNDFDIYSLVYCMIRYIEITQHKDFKLINKIDLEKIKTICTDKKMSYNLKIAHHLSEIIDGVNSESLVASKLFFDKNIFLIP
ncbi:conserved hypothetical protein [Alteracholeplasma palmae J233]|uniref:Uncharacterized protein n=1 Tax=Alteracholeplasma palmae (strain ATCC 49389 / J233) TaxID=1318466 RepID=U4KPQ2_ALTPJ|nr:hypothetical protein [Alteracholeplasma palmae]CCV64260.1 conserved hypothetical protein [Alteracholeplasma palmae J233]